MKIKHSIWLILLVLLLSGCRVEWTLSSTSDNKTSPNDRTPQENYEKSFSDEDAVSVFINGDVEYNEEEIIINGFTDLEEGTILKVFVRKYPDGAALRDTIDGTVKPVEQPISEEQVTIDHEGNFNVTFQREDAERSYYVTAQFNPEIQPENIQEIYGSKGEKIVYAPKVYHYEIEGKTYIGVKVSAYIGLRPLWTYLREEETE